MSEAMNEHDDLPEAQQGGNEGIAQAPEPVARPTSYGASLAYERQLRNMSVGDIASRLRLHMNQVRAIEAENLAALPGVPYVRGFVRGYARALGLDPQPFLDDINARIAPGAAAMGDGSKGDYSPVRAAARERISRHVILIGSVVGIVALGLVGWAASMRAPAVRVAASPVLVAPPSTAPVPVPAPAPASATPLAPTPSAAAGPAVAAAEPVVAAPILKLRFAGKSWVEVTAADEKILLSKRVEAGAEYQLEGALPLSVVLGDASKVAVEFRGEPLDLAPYVRQNVARLTLY